MRTTHRVCIITLSFFLSGAAVHAQTLLRAHVLSAGAAQSAGGGLTLSATVGQPVIGRADGGVTAWQGFWYQRSGPGPATTVARLADGGGYTLHHGYPNPFRETSVIAVELREPLPVRVDVCDALGRLLYTAHESSGARGTVLVRIDGTRLAEGRSYARISVGGVQHLLPLLLLR